MHETEDLFVCYAEDTVDRVILEMRKQMQQETQKASETRLSRAPVTKYALRKEYACSVNLLLNDIQEYANLLRDFRLQHAQWFEPEELTPSNKHEEDQYVTVSPELSSVFCQLNLIDDYRV